MPQPRSTHLPGRSIRDLARVLDVAPAVIYHHVDRPSSPNATLLNNAILTISIGDDRLFHEYDGPHDHATMMAEFRRAAADRLGGVPLDEVFIAPFAEGREPDAEPAGQRK